MLLQTLIAASMAGTASHSIFIRGEWHLNPASLVLKYFFLAVLAFAMDYQLSSRSIDKAMKSAFAIIGMYLAGLYGSITIYRFFFHPLRRIPGPILARVTNFWHVYKSVGSQNHLVIDDLHRNYGPVVRTG